MGKKLKLFSKKKLRFIWLGIMLIVVFFIGRFWKKEKIIERIRYPVEFKDTATEFSVEEISVENRAMLLSSIGKFVKIKGIISDVKSSKSKKVILIFFAGVENFKAVKFTEPSENTVFLNRFRNLSGKIVSLPGRIIEHERYGLELIIDDKF